MPSKDDFQLNSLIKSSLEPRVSIKFALMKHLFKNMKTRHLKYNFFINNFFMDFHHLDLFAFLSFPSFLFFLYILPEIESNLDDNFISSEDAIARMGDWKYEMQFT